MRASTFIGEVEHVFIFEEIELLLEQLHAVTIEQAKLSSRGQRELEFDGLFYFKEVVLVGLLEAPCCLALLQADGRCVSVTTAVVQNCNLNFL